MKRIKFILCLLMSISLFGCSEDTQINKEEIEVFEEVEETHNYTYEPQNFNSVFEEINLAKKDIIENADLSKGREYLVQDPSTHYLLTDEEVKLLLNPQENNKDHISKDELLYDIDLLFRVFESTYGAYYFFAREDYDNAKKELEDWANTITSVAKNDCKDRFFKAFSFLQDGHTWVGDYAIRRGNFEFCHYYCDGQYYSKDDNGFYKTEDNIKWYVDSFDDENIIIVLWLLENGDIVYSPIRFSNENLESSILTIKSEKGEIRQETLQWIKRENYSEFSIHEPNFNYGKSNDIAYIAIRSFPFIKESTSIQKFIETANDVKDCKAIVFDIRSNGGGDSSESANKWTNIFANTNIENKLPIYRASRSSKLAIAGDKQQGNYGYHDFLNKGKVVENNIPIYVLVDNNCGSNGETMLNNLRNLDNTIIIGGNSCGYQLGGNYVDIFLPNTNVEACIGTFYNFMYEVKNVDGIGYMPEIWCNPKDSKKAVANLLKKETDINDSDIDNTINKNYEIAVTYKFNKKDEIRLNGTFYLTLEGFDGNPDEITLKVDDESVCKAYALDNGIVVIEPLKKDETELYIYVDNYGFEKTYELIVDNVETNYKPVNQTQNDSIVYLASQHSKVLDGEKTVLRTTTSYSVQTVGRTIKSYTAKCLDENICQMKIDDKNKLILTPVSTGNTSVIVNYGGCDYTFNIEVK